MILGVPVIPNAAHRMYLRPCNLEATRLVSTTVIQLLSTFGKIAEERNAGTLLRERASGQTRLNPGDNPINVTASRLGSGSDQATGAAALAGKNGCSRGYTSVHVAYLCPHAERVA
jgi:hypothetical protein